MYIYVISIKNKAFLIEIKIYSISYKKYDYGIERYLNFYKKKFFKVFSIIKKSKKNKICTYLYHILNIKCDINMC